MLEYPIRVWGSPRVITVSPLCNGPGPVTPVYLIDCPTPVRVRVSNMVSEPVFFFSSLLSSPAATSSWPPPQPPPAPGRRPCARAALRARLAAAPAPVPLYARAWPPPLRPHCSARAPVLPSPARLPRARRSSPTLPLPPSDPRPTVPCSPSFGRCVVNADLRAQPPVLVLGPWIFRPRPTTPPQRPWARPPPRGWAPPLLCRVRAPRG